MGRAAMGRAREDRGRAATGRGRTGRASGRGGKARASDLGATGRPSTVRGVGRRSTAHVTVHGTMVREGLGRGGSSAARRARVVRRIDGDPRGHDPTGAVPAVRVVPVVRMRGGLRVLGRSGAVRGRDRVIDSDRVRGRVSGIDRPTSGARGRERNPGVRTTGGLVRIRIRIVMIATDRASVHAAIERAMDHARAGRPAGARSPVRPAVAALVPIGRTARGPRAGARTGARRSSPVTAVRPGRRPCHPRRRSARTRSSSLVDARSRKRSLRVVPRSVCSSFPSGEPPSRSSCFMPRTCGSRSSKSKVAR